MLEEKTDKYRDMHKRFFQIHRHTEIEAKPGSVQSPETEEKIQSICTDILNGCHLALKASPQDCYYYFFLGLACFHLAADARAMQYIFIGTHFADQEHAVCYFASLISYTNLKNLTERVLPAAERNDQALPGLAAKVPSSITLASHPKERIKKFVKLLHEAFFFRVLEMANDFFEEKSYLKSYHSYVTCLRVLKLSNASNPYIRPNTFTMLQAALQEKLVKIHLLVETLTGEDLLVIRQIMRTLEAMIQSRHSPTLFKPKPNAMKVALETCFQQCNLLLQACTKVKKLSAEAKTALKKLDMLHISSGYYERYQFAEEVKPKFVEPTWVSNRLYLGLSVSLLRQKESMQEIAALLSNEFDAGETLAMGVDGCSASFGKARMTQG
jgi:hypothetical protein